MPMGRRRQKYDYVFVPNEETHRLRTALITLLVILVLGAGLFLMLNFISNNQVKLETVRVTVHNLPDDLENWSILHISDLHGQQLGTNQSAIRQALGTKAYSSVVFTGDMLGPDGDVQPFLDLLALLPSDVPKFMIAGDSDPTLVDMRAHGSLSVFSDWVQQVQAMGVTVLDEPLKVTRGKSNIWFIPEYLYSLDLDSMESAYTSQLNGLNANATALTADQAAQKRAVEYQLEKIGRLRTMNATLTDKDIQIAVTHTPLTRSYVSTIVQWQGKDKPFALRNAALVLAGHYCGGQWRIPGKGALYVPELGWFPDDRLIQGLDYLAGIPQYISPGLGASEDYPWMPGRVFNSPTITLIYLHQDGM